MKVVVLGCNGFVGSNLVKKLSSKYQIIPINRYDIDLLDTLQVNYFLKNNVPDVVINATASMTDDHLLHDARNNLSIFMNFYNNSSYFGKFINIGSGAEFDRRYDINNVKEEQIFEKIPNDSYGWGLNIKSRLCLEKENFYTLRIFNCFGLGERNTRIFPKFLNNQSNKFQISNDRYFDYFGINDFCKVVEYFIEQDPLYKDINTVYENKFKISEVLDVFCRLNNLQSNFVVQSVSKDNYTGDGTLLKLLPISLDGLDLSLKNYLKG
jgi:GDP-L-fucose synthase